MTWMFALAFAASVFGFGRDCEPAVEAYLSYDPQSPLRLVRSAETIADQIFGDAGLSVKWYSGRLKSRAANTCDAIETIEISLDDTTREQRGAETLGYSLPAQADGVRVHIFMDRIHPFASRANEMLAHVLAHEIGHVIEGGTGHSAEGVMKAHFDLADLQKMSRHHLKFADVDVEMMRAHFRVLLSKNARGGEALFASPPRR